MEMSMLEKSILAKMPLPNEVHMLIKKYLQVPTPTARLMKQVSFDSTQYINRTCIRGTGVRIYELRGRWSAPPLRPEIEYLHRYVDIDTWESRRWNINTGEPARGTRLMRLMWPVLRPASQPSWSYVTEKSADDMARRVRSWMPVSI